MKICNKIIILFIFLIFSCDNQERTHSVLTSNCFNDFNVGKTKSDTIIFNEIDSSLYIKILDFSNIKKYINEGLILENEIHRVLKVKLYNSYKCLKENKEVLNIKKYGLKINTVNINSEYIYFDSIFYNLKLSEIMMNKFVKEFNSSNYDLNKVLKFYSIEILKDEKEVLIDMLTYTKNEWGEIILNEIRDFGYSKVIIDNQERILLRILVEGQYTKIERRSQFVFDYFVDNNIEFMGFHFMEYRGYIEYN